MSDTQSTEKIKSLSASRTWNINDVTWILLGHENGAKHFQDYFNQDTISGWGYGDGEHSEEALACHNLLEEILDRFNSGRFGRLLVECMDEFETTNTIHPLRVVDWIKEKDILELSQFKQNHPRDIQQMIVTLLEAIDANRPDKNDEAHNIDYVELARSDFWVLTELRIVLFGETYLNQYNPALYQKLIPEIENRKKKVDQLIENAITLGRVKAYQSPSFRQPLITYTNKLDDYIDLFPGDDNYIGVYDSSELGIGCRMYQPMELLKALQSKGCPISETLLNPIEREQFETVGALLQELPKLMEGFLEQKPTEPQAEALQKSNPLNVPQGTTWSEISFTLNSENNSFSIKIKSHIQRLNPEQFFKLFPNKTSSGLLCEIIKRGGTFHKDLFRENPQKYFKQYLSRLRQTLKFLFLIDDDPIESLGDGQYKTRFRASHQKYLES